VDGQDISGVRLVLEPAMSVAGHVVFDGTGPAPDPSSVRVTLMPILSGASVAFLGAPSQSDAQGHFALNNVTPGRYRIGATVTAPARSAGSGMRAGLPGADTAGQPSPRAAGPIGPAPGASAWTLKSAVLNGHETLDTGLDVKPGESVNDVVLTLTDRPTTITGTLSDASGRPASDYYIIVYAADSAFWAAPTRRVSMARPASDGKFTVRGLPAGDYLLAAVTDLEPGEFMDPHFLAPLGPASIPIHLGEGEAKVQDVRIAGR
jgi:hypothetical protein